MSQAYETWEDAIKSVVVALGGTKEVGHMLWPALDLERAREKLDHCLSRNHKQKLDLDEVRFINREGKKVGCHSSVEFVNADAGYSQPDPIAPKDELAELMKNYIESQKAITQLSDQIERIQQGGKGKRPVMLVPSVMEVKI